MAQVPYDHIEAPGRVMIGGTLAYAPGDPIPVDVAARYEIEGDVIEGVDAPTGDAVFTDSAIVIREVGDDADDADRAAQAAEAAQAAQATPTGAPPAPTRAARTPVTPPTKEQ